MIILFFKKNHGICFKDQDRHFLNNTQCDKLSNRGATNRTLRPGNASQGSKETKQNKLGRNNNL